MAKENISKALIQEVERLRFVAEICLDPDHPVKLNDFERSLLLDAKREIGPALTAVLAVLDGNEQAIDNLYKFFQCVQHIGPITVLTDCQKESFRPKIKVEQADSARNARAESSEEKALFAAIREFYPNETCEHPSTTANQILERVNKRLARDKYLPVSRHVVYRRLGKLPRS